MALQDRSSPRRPGFGEAFTDHMVAAVWSPAAGWHDLVLEPWDDLPMSPAMVGLHYGQVVFEGLKAHRCEDGTLAMFRPRDHALRFQRSARRLDIPEFPVPMFLQAAERLVAADGHRLSDDPSLSLYLRPLLYASEACLALRPAAAYRFLLVAFTTGGFFGNRPEPVAVWINRDQARAMPGGTGDVKVAGNYAPTYLAQQRAAAHGCQQVVWLDAVSQRWVEELGGMNLFFVRGRGEAVELVTPPASGTLLPGVTRAALTTLSGDRGWRVREEPVGIDQWRTECGRGEITEVFACGTAAGVTPVGKVCDGDGGWAVADGEPGPVTLALRAALAAAQRGSRPDPHGWLHPVPQQALDGSEAR